jgi:RNA polymerase sigma-70 factor (ECF subfamily)
VISQAAFQTSRSRLGQAALEPPPAITRAAGAEDAAGLSAASDEELAEQAQDGSREAFEEIVIRYHRRLRSFLLRRTGGSFAEAEDAAQEAFIRAWQRIGTYRRGRPLRPWLFTIAAREAAHNMRREAQLAQRVRSAAPERRRNAIEADDRATTLRLTSDARETFGEAWAIAERLLSADQLGVLWLRYVEDLQPRQISHALGKTGVAVRVSLLRSRATIAEEIARRRAAGSQNLTLEGPRSTSDSGKGS